MMLLVGCICWEEELCEEQCNRPEVAQPRPAVVPLSGVRAFTLMVLT
jgi:hypothetical protein